MKKLLALVLALVMSMSLVTISNAAFKDADKIDYDEAVEVMNAVGVLVGDEKGNFNAKENLTREQAAKIISYLLLGNKTAEALVGAAKFTDVAATRWSAGFVDYCASTGVVAGNGNGTFAPAGQLTGFQFAKMLLVALGYDAKIEGFTGTDWQINVSKVANQVGLFNGLSISGTAVLTREQGAQMCLNTLKAPLVQYSNKGGNLSVNGAVIEIGASKAEYVTTTLAKEQRISDRTLTNTGLNTTGGYTVEFGEKYYPALELKTDSDDFDRPAHQWLHNNKKIGSYVDYDLMVAEYTTAIDGKDLYEKLGSSIIKEYDVTYYVDGQVNTTIKASNMIKANTIDYATTGKGVLTQVFVDDDAKEITIVSINTFAAEVTADYNSKKETLSIDIKDAPKNENGYQVTETLSSDDFDGLDKYKDGDVVLVTVAETSTNKYTVQTVADPQVLSDKDVTKFSENKYLVTDGTQYDYAKNGQFWNELGKYYGSKLDNSYNIFIDAYGYVIATQVKEGTDKYVFITGYDLGGSHLATKNADAFAIFTDGTSANIKVNVQDTNKNIGKSEYYAELREGDNQYNRWFTYTTSEKSGSTVYTLAPINVNGYVTVGKNQVDCGSFAFMFADDEGQNINVNNVRIVDKSKRAYGNDDSVFITVETDEVTTSVDGTMPLGITKVTGTYTGVQNVDIKVFNTSDNKLSTDDMLPDSYNKIKTQPGVFALYDSDKYIIAAVIIGEDNNTTDSYAYAIKSAQNEYKDSNDNYYWDFEAVVDGKITTLTVKEKGTTVLRDTIANAVGKENLGAYSMFKLTYDKNGYVVGAEQIDDVKEGNSDKLYDRLDFGKSTIVDGDKFKVYDVYHTTDANLYAVGRTLYVNNKANSDVGLTIAKDAPVVVIENYTTGLKIEEYDTIKQALDALDDSTHFKGHIAAALNTNGTAKYLVLKSIANVKVDVDDGSSKTNGFSAKVDVAARTVTITLPKDTKTKDGAAFDVVNNGLDNLSADNQKAAKTVIYYALDALGYEVQAYNNKSVTAAKTSNSTGNIDFGYEFVVSET